MRWKFWAPKDPIYMNQDRPASLGLIGKISGGILGGYLLGCVLFAFWWDSEPDQFPVRQNATRLAEINSDSLVTGYVTTATVIQIGATLLGKNTMPGIFEQVFIGEFTELRLLHDFHLRWGLRIFGPKPWELGSTDQEFKPRSAIVC